ncbi:hypothetical protein SAMN05421595_0691 [Austwickia chelonae]|uniref:PE domain-containing protein n=1 Tax=Austwickia chelonae NBRC 105200 TaxID=1184607 RepID=K6VS55_9MICO|nr:hypothetical protein [Austwickia chelonae]GAB78170.1 hypothetical protein AUCHE_08_04150 [Austwickia chelonae NBRC 105200]SEV98138.1 hypothetical protein SAMN05421595_0691 [Austwickia chelonae]
MPSYDFEVDLPTLTAAANAVEKAVQGKKDNDVVDYVPMKDDLRHEVVWAAVSEFMNRWEIGTNAMVDDVEEISSRLSRVAAKYADFEEQGAARLSGSVGELPRVPRPGQ